MIGVIVARNDSGQATTAPLRDDPSRISRAESIARKIEEDILDDGLPAGHRLGTKDDLRRRFGVAAATVNEALRILDTRGLVDARPGPGGGVFVASPLSRVHMSHMVLGFGMGDAPFSDCLEVRNALEPLVCRGAAESCTAKDASALRALVKAMGGQLENPLDFLRLNWELHRRLAKMCANAPLKSLYLTLLDFVESALQDVRPDEFFDPEDNLRVHEELVEAVVSGDSERLEAAVRRHTPSVNRWGSRSDVPAAR